MPFEELLDQVKVCD